MCLCGVREQTYGHGDVEAAEVGCCPVVDLTLCVESAVAVVSRTTPNTAPVGQAVQVCPVPAARWVSGGIKCIVLLLGSTNRNTQRNQEVQLQHSMFVQLTTLV